jgi:hypothetical protein
VVFTFDFEKTFPSKNGLLAWGMVSFPANLFFSLATFLHKFSA